MNLSQQKLECGSCGAASMAPKRQTLWKCEYCGAVTIFDGIEADPTADLKENIAKRTRKIESVLTKKANYLHDGISDGGNLHVTRSEIVFVPHAFNINSGYRLVFPFSEMKDIRKENAMLGLSRQLVVEMKDSSGAAFIVWGRDEIIKCIQNLIS